MRAAGAEYASLLAAHRRLIRQALDRHDGTEVGTEGDSFFVAFVNPIDAIDAALEAQRSLCAHTWPESREVRVRMGIHTGEVAVISNDYVGLAVHHAHRVSSAAHGGQILLSQETADLVRDSMPSDASLLDLGFHRLKDIEGPQKLFQVEHPELQRDFPALAAIGALPTNLPEALTSFVGREAELEEVTTLLDGTRLLTLTGAGGMGKTRLATELGRRLVSRFSDGAWLVELAPIAEPELVPQTIGLALGLREQKADGRPWLARLTDHVRDKSILLVLDNCEHLVPSCAEFIEALLGSCKGLRIVATSREGVGAEGETRWQVPPLRVAESDDAVRLFMDRARDRNPTLHLDERTMAVVADLCRRLEGIPLAIELAAARADMLSVEEIAARLDDRFRLLAADRRATARHQTMRTAIDWSYDLLNERERALFRRLSAFASFTLDDAETVCAADPITQVDTLDVLSALVRKSLVLSNSGPQTTRYRMLETIREYALEKLAASGEKAWVRTRHQDHFAARTEQWQELAFDGAFEDAAALFDADIDNIRLALQWTPPGTDGQAALRICAATEAFWEGVLGDEGLRHARTALAADSGPPSPARLGALATAQTLAWGRTDVHEMGALADEAAAVASVIEESSETAWPRTGSLIAAAWVLAFRDGDLARARRKCEEAIATAKRAGHTWSIGAALFAFGGIARLQEDYTAAAAKLEEARTLISVPRAPLLGALAEVKLELGDTDQARRLAAEAVAVGRASRSPEAVLWGLYAISLIALKAGDVAVARASAEEWVSIGRSLGDRISGVAIGLTHLALACAAGRDYAAAERHLLESMSIVDELAVDPVAAFCRYTLGEVHESTEDLVRAAEQYERALEIYRAQDDLPNAVRCLEALAGVAAAQGRLERATDLISEAGARRAGAVIPPWPWRHIFPQPNRERWMAAARAGQRIAARR